jgi:hypothetical protein
MANRLPNPCWFRSVQKGGIRSPGRDAGLFGRVSGSLQGGSASWLVLFVSPVALPLKWLQSCFFW